MTNATALERFLALLYTDATARNAFLADPVRATADAGLDDADRTAVLAIDRDGLALAAQSFTRKRAGRSAVPRSFAARMEARLRGVLSRRA